MTTSIPPADDPAELVYLAIYQRVAAKSDYLQPDAYRQMLPDAATTALVVSVIVGVAAGISQGFLGKIGENLAEKVSGLLKRPQPKEPTPDELVVVVREVLPYLTKAELGWDGIAACIALELTRRGLPFAVAAELASEIVEDMRRQLGG
jgi:hypothetical protein